MLKISDSQAFIVNEYYAIKVFKMKISVRFWWVSFLFFVLTVGSKQITVAQETTKAQSMADLYDRVTIYPMGPGRYVKHDTLYTGLGMMKNEFAISEGALKLYVRSQRNRNITLVLSLGVAIMPTRTAATFNKPFYQRPLYYVALGVGFVSSLFNAKATSQLNQATWIYNRDALIRSQYYDPLPR